MKKTFALFLFLFVLTTGQFAQAQQGGSAGDQAKLESRYIVNDPTAGVLKRGQYTVEGFLFPQDGTLVGLGVGLSDKLSFGISYGGTGIIGNSKPQWNSLPGVNVRYRIIEESLGFPAVTFGFDSQGRGVYYDSLKRYDRKSPGFFAVGSKNFDFLGYLTLHGGLNYSLENTDDKDLNFYLGAEKTLGSEITIAAEYDAGLNDNSPKAFGKRNGYLDAAAKWSIGGGLTLEFQLTNLLDNAKNTSSISRSLRLEYVNAF
jgi:hypothetical protein